MEISRDKKSEWIKKTVKQMEISTQEEWVEQEDSETDGYKNTRRVSGTRRQWNRWKYVDKKSEWNKKTVKQMEISRDEKSEWIKKTVKQMEISRDEKSEWIKKTVKQMEISTQEEWVEQEDSKTDGNK